MTDSGLPIGYAGQLEPGKPWFLSTGIIGSIIALAAPIISGVGHVTIGPGDVTTAMDIVNQQMQTVGAMMALIGRIKATHTVG